MADTATPSSDDSNKTVDLSDGPVDLHQLHMHVVSRHARVEFITRACDGSCILISKAELESLESALEILSGTDDVREMRNELSRLVAQTLPLAG
jgi:PHD/YefM family antitoxin component YafN of YafNO toxin-antitoxin module